MKIITLTGSSASGKDFLLKEVVKENKDFLDTIVSTTTRPMREGEVDGVDYNFVSFDEFQELYSDMELIEYREYQTVEGNWYYGIPKNAIDLNSDKTYIVILDIGGVIKLREYLTVIQPEIDNKIEITSIFIHCSGQERMMRSLSREGILSDYQVAELCRRYLDDLQNVAAYKDAFEIVLRNETPEDMKRNKLIIGGLIPKKHIEECVEI